MEKFAKKAAEQMKAHKAEKDAHSKSQTKTSVHTAGCECPACKAKAAQVKTSVQADGCQCPACKANAAKSDK